MPILYLPGISRPHLRAVETCPRHLQPLAELQYRGVLWSHRNGKDWTPAAFLQSSDGGVGVEVAGDSATRDALQLVLVKLADEPVADLQGQAPLSASYFRNLVEPDPVRSILL